MTLVKPSECQAEKRELDGNMEGRAGGGVQESVKGAPHTTDKGE